MIAQDRPTKEDEHGYLEYVEPAEDSLHKAFTFWQFVRRGVVKGHNVDSLEVLVDLLRQKVRERQTEYILQHPNIYASMYYFNFNLVNSPRVPVDSLAAMYRRFSKDLRVTALGKAIDSAIKKKKTLALNNEMPLFTFRAYNGQKIDLVSFRQEKYVLLCFWDSWCPPCIRNIPMLKTLYHEYKGKGLELISVSIDNDEQKWLTTVKKYDMPWLQTVDLPRYISSSRVRSLYDIHYIPQYFLLNKEGKLIYQNSFSNDGDDHAVLRQILTELLK